MSPEEESQAVPTFQWAVQWPDSNTGPYTVDLEATIIGERYEIVAVEMRGQPRLDFGLVDEFSSVPIRSLDLRLPLRSLLDAHLETVRASLVSESARTYGNPLNSPGLARARRVLAGQPKRPGRPRLYDREHFEKVAKVYTEAAQFGRPTQAVADEWAVSTATAKKWVARCRSDEFKLLPKTTRGRATTATTRPKRGKQ